MQKYFLTLLISLLCAITASADNKEIKVSGSYTYYCMDNETPGDAKRRAVEGAKKEALIQAFGILVDDNTYYDLKEQDGEVSSDFISVMSSNVRGEWIKTIDSKVDMDFDEEKQVLVVHAAVEGMARSIDFVRPSIRASLLGHCDDSFEKDCSEFLDGESFYLRFKSPVKGYLLVYLLDEKGKASRLLPYGTSNKSNVEIAPQKEYTFFSLNDAPRELYEFTQELHFFAKNKLETNTMLIIFSENPIYIAPDVNPDNDEETDEMLPRELEAFEFMEFLGDLRTKDLSAQVIKKTIKIKK